MKIKIEKNELLKKVRAAIQGVPSRTTMPIQECIAIVAKDGEVTFTANSISIGVKTVAEGSIIEEGSAAVDAKTFSGFAGKLPDGTVTLSCNNKKELSVVCGKTKLKASGMEPGEFSFLKDAAFGTRVCVKQPEFRDALKGVLIAIPDNDNNKAMACVQVKAVSGEMTLTALDGHRIARRTLQADGPDADILIPGDMLKKLLPLLSGKEGSMEITVMDNSAQFSFGETVVHLQSVSEKYFDVDRMIESSYPVNVRVNKMNLLETVDRAMLFQSEASSMPLILDVRDDSVNASAKSYAGGMSEDIDAEKTGSDLKIGFNPKFVLDALKEIDDEEISLELGSSKSPCVIRGDGYLHLILPVNINAAA
ncbi:MAG: DNA polymerase III subunit beta [Clostridiales bacterium]|nr:DNA polymerase III subunit beta [Clostridiales bacterium]